MLGSWLCAWRFLCRWGRGWRGSLTTQRHRGSSKVKCNKEAKNANIQEPSQKGNMLAYKMVCVSVKSVGMAHGCDHVTWLCEDSRFNCVASNLFSAFSKFTPKCRPCNVLLGLQLCWHGDIGSLHEGDPTPTSSTSPTSTGSCPLCQLTVDATIIDGAAIHTATTPEPVVADVVPAIS